MWGGRWGGSSRPPPTTLAVGTPWTPPNAAAGDRVIRPDANAARFRRSSRRMALPELPEETFIEAINLLLQHDHAWVPSAPDHSLYLRPFMFASDVGLGVHLGGEVTFLLIASPSGSYFKSGVKPVTVWLEE